MTHYLKNVSSTEHSVNFYPPGVFPPVQGTHLKVVPNHSQVTLLKDHGFFSEVSHNGERGIVKSQHLQPSAGYVSSGLSSQAKALYATGTNVEYESSRNRGWIAAVVLAHNPDGSYMLDVQPRALPQKVRLRVGAPNVIKYSPTAQVKLWFNGQQFSDFSALQNATAVKPDELRNVPIRDLLGPSHKSKLEQKIKSLFYEYAGSNRLLEYTELVSLVYSFAAQLGISVSVFAHESADIEDMFERYDFSGDGRLDVDEGVMLIKGMLRKHRDERGVSMSCEDVPLKVYTEAFDEIQKLGAGAFGQVFLAKDKNNGQERAIKKFPQNDARCSLDEIFDEFSLCRDLDHKNITRNFEIFKDHAMIYLVSEPYRGGDLSKVRERAQEHHVEVNARWWTRIWHQVCEGIAYLHQKHIVHCDIKEENVMIAGKSNWEAPHIAIIDFGISQNFVGTGRKAGGTPGYIPREVWMKGLWTAKGDIFSIGVLIFKTLTRKIPFGQEVLENASLHPAVDIQAGLQQATLNCGAPPQIGDPQYFVLNTLLAQMLQRSHRDRPTLQQALAHSWFQINCLDSGPLSRGSARRFTGLALGSKNLLHLALLREMASQTNVAQDVEALSIWGKLDLDKDGQITPTELRRALRNNVSDADIEAVIKAIAPSGGSIEFSEFMAYMMENRGLEDVFGFFDVDKNGYLERAEIEKLASSAKIAEMLPGLTGEMLMMELDLNGDGKVSLSEFLEFLTARLESSLRSLGLLVRYQSRASGEWFKTQIVDRREDGAIMLALRRGDWLDKQEQAERVRPIT